MRQRRRTSSIAAAAIALLAAAILAACGTGGGDSPSSRSVQSPDGRATLVIPPGALPDGVGIEDISLTPLDPETLAVAADQSGVLGAYGASPDGLTFLEPVMLSIESPFDGDGTLPTLFHVTAEGISPLLESRVGFDLDAETIVVEAEIASFSDFVLYAGWSQFTVTKFELPDELFVGDTFIWDIVVEPRHDPRYAEPTPRNTPYRYAGGVRLQDQGSYMVNRGALAAIHTTGRALAPLRLPLREETLSTRDPFVIDEQFTCRTSGSDRIVIGEDSWNASLTIEYTAVVEQGAYSPRFGYHSTGRFIEVPARTSLVIGDHLNCRDQPIPEDAEFERTGVSGDDLTFPPADPSTDLSAGGNPLSGVGLRVLMLRIDGVLLPVAQFDVMAAGEPEPEHSCPRPHYHVRGGSVAYGLTDAQSEDTELVSVSDPDPSGCGFGRYDDLERVNVDLWYEERALLAEHLGGLSADRPRTTRLLESRVGPCPRRAAVSDLRADFHVGITYVRRDAVEFPPAAD